MQAYNTIIHAYCKAGLTGDSAQAVSQLLACMAADGIPPAADTYTILVNALADVSGWGVGVAAMVVLEAAARCHAKW